MHNHHRPQQQQQQHPQQQQQQHPQQQYHQQQPQQQHQQQYHQQQYQQQQQQQQQHYQQQQQQYQQQQQQLPQFQIHVPQPSSPKHSIPPLADFLQSHSKHHFSDPSVGPVISNASLPLCHANNMLMCSTTVIGTRPDQQDRYVMAPSLLNGELSLFAVFDGTTGDYAAEWLREHCISHLIGIEGYRTLACLKPNCKVDPSITQPILSHLLSHLYHVLDKELLQHCLVQSQDDRNSPEEQFKYDYTASTGVIVLIHHPSNQLCISHVADSHAVIAAPYQECNSLNNSQLINLELQREHHIRTTVQRNLQIQPILQGTPEQRNYKHNQLQQQLQQQLQLATHHYILSFGLTKSHKPDENEELLRIQNAGGQLVYLHDQKPFIRGKDFRQKKKAIQLNYSRAFGSKDLKHSGLICSPDMTMITLKNKIQNYVAVHSNGGVVVQHGDGDNNSNGGLDKIQTQKSGVDIEIIDENDKNDKNDQNAPKTMSENDQNAPTTQNEQNDEAALLEDNGNDDIEPKKPSDSTISAIIADVLRQNNTTTALETIKPAMDPHSIHSPSVPYVNTGVLTPARHQPTLPDMVDSDVYSEDSPQTDEDTDDTYSPQQDNRNLNNVLTNENDKEDKKITDENDEKKIADENEEKIAEEKFRAAIHQAYPSPQTQVLHNLHDVNKLPHNPSLRMCHGKVDIRAIVIGSDGVFDVLDPNEVITAAFTQLDHCIETGVHKLPPLHHIPMGTAPKFIEMHKETLLAMRVKALVSIYPDFLAMSSWSIENDWGYSPSDAIVAQALLQHEMRRSGDNVTAIVVFF